jgi:hypothetical protein
MRIFGCLDMHHYIIMPAGFAMEAMDHRCFMCREQNMQRGRIRPRSRSAKTGESFCEHDDLPVADIQQVASFKKQREESQSGQYGRTVESSFLRFLRF